MTIASSSNYLLVKVHGCDDYVSSYHIYCFVVIMFIYAIFFHYSRLCCVEFPSTVLVI